MISTSQKAIIRKICRAQEQSLLRVEKMIAQIHKEMVKDGYEVTEADVALAIAENLKQWGDVKQEPEKFWKYLDEQNIGFIKHHLVNDFLGNEDARPIWKQLNLFDNVNRFRN